MSQTAASGLSMVRFTPSEVPFGEAASYNGV